MSNGQKYSPLFAGDLLHPYFRADSRLLTVSDVAKRLGVCAATVYKLSATGALQHVRVLNSIRIADDWLRAFIAGHSRRPTQGFDATAVFDIGTGAPTDGHSWKGVGTGRRN